MKRFSKKEIFSIPNLMGYFRILLIPVFCYLYITAETEREYLYAALVVLLSSLTDLFDGKIARRFHMVTELGKALDPIADKLYACSTGNLPCNPLSYDVGADCIDAGQGRLHGGYGAHIPEERKDAGWSDVVWQGLYCSSVCRTSCPVFVFTA